MTEPPVWLPSAIGSMPAATAAAEPDDDPPGVCAGLRGLRVRGRLERSELGGDGLAEDDAAGAPHQHHHRGVRSSAGGRHRSASRRRSASRGVEDVLDADRQARAAAAAASCRRVRALPGRVDVERGERADLALVRGDRLGAQLDDGARPSGRRPRSGGQDRGRRASGPTVDPRDDPLGRAGARTA